ncbi:MAG TPA: tetratricopeptide repeat protein [Kofleriaceae bacterium]|nr:tetratricopeptide repeat protein [Kofleriaceae bacterium]
MDIDLELILARADEQPTDVEARIAAAYALDRADREDEAIVHYDAAWRLGIPDDRRHRFLVGYGVALRTVGRLEEAVALLGEATTASPAYPPYKAFLALALHSAGEHTAALATMMDALLDVAAGASLDGYDQALAHHQRELLDQALAGAR